MNRRRLALLALLSALTILFAATEAAASVAYIDGNEVWVSSDDGARKLRLSGGENDWREVAQSDQGHIIGTRREAGKVSQLTSFTIWDPNGKVMRFGALSGDTGCTNAYPLGLDITPSGGNLVYGFSCYTYGYPVGSLVTGTYLKVSADATTMVPLKLTAAKFPTLVGTRIVGATSDNQVAVQDPSSIGSDNFTDWFVSTLAGHKIFRTDVAATGTTAYTEQMVDDSSAAIDKLIASRWGSFGGGPYVDDCYMPISGPLHNVSASQDAASVTWQDARGVVIAGVPTFGGSADCQLTRPPVVISATGGYPSYGPFNVAAAQNSGVGGPAVTSPPSVKLSAALRSGFRITVTPAVGGRATVRLTIKPSKVGRRGKKEITLATGSATVTAGRPAKITVRFTATGKKLKKKLRGKKATLVVTVGTTSTTRTIKLS
jgi:hypothetical protein